MGIPGSSFFNWESGAIKDAAEEALRRHGGSYSSALQDIQIGGLERGFGANDDNVKEYLINKQRNAINNDPRMQALATASDAPIYASGGFANQGESLQAVNARLKGLRETKTEATRQQRLGETIEAETRAQGRALEIGQQGIDAANTRFSTQLESQRLDNQASRDQQNAQYAHTSKMARLDRGLERELSQNNTSMQLALGQMNADLADKRMEYDRETARMDKRSAAIAQLMSGLGSLGGAFSL